MVICVLCMIIAVYIFAVNFVVANAGLLASQQVFPEPSENVTESRPSNATEITETASLGASLSVTVAPRYGVLPIYSSVFGDLKWIHRIFMWIIYFVGLMGLVKANGLVLIGNPDKGASDLVRGFYWLVGVFVSGLFLSFTEMRLIHDLGYALRIYAIPTFGFVGVLFLLRLYVYTHPETWEKFRGVKEKVW